MAKMVVGTHNALRLMIRNENKLAWVLIFVASRGRAEGESYAGMEVIFRQLNRRHATKYNLFFLNGITKMPFSEKDVLRVLASKLKAASDTFRL